jgi:AcrR family transcriptional regulator
MPGPLTQSHPAPSPNKADADRHRILVAFERRASVAGPRAVVIAELVRGLGISTRTLYRLFPNKAAMVDALMVSWAQLWAERQQQGLEEGLGPRQRIEYAALNWLEHSSKFSEEFWLQLQRDFPAAHQIYQNEYAAFLERSRENLSPAVRPDLNPDLALLTLMTMIDGAADSKRCEQLNITPRDATLQIIDIWASGALAAGSGPIGGDKH